MKVLVTGGGSMLLGGVAAALAARGDEVVCLQRRPIHVPDGVRQVQGDVRQPDAVRSAAEGCDAILHGAARVGVLGTWDDFRSVNVDGTSNVLAAARAAGVSRVVHVSTPSVAHSGHSLVGAGADAAVTGRKGAFYAESKALAELLALAANSPELAVVAIRPHLVWGPGDTQLVGRIVERAAAGRLVMVGDGSALVDTTYIDNAVSAHVAALDAVRPGAVCAGSAYVVANGEPRTVRELVEGICRAAGVPFAPREVPAGLAVRVGGLVERLWPRFRDGEPPITRFVAEQLGTAHWFDPRPMRDDIGWRPHVTLDEGFELLRQSFARSAA
ncbi:MAG: NAD-dependent epimerase/dehydratase family protein [Actinomycetota bacterium]|nr:NAD-dependent epimerase/dehydratase family protein [Actinomycetota bacterium]